MAKILFSALFPSLLLRSPSALASVNNYTTSARAANEVESHRGDVEIIYFFASARFHIIPLLRDIWHEICQSLGVGERAEGEGVKERR